MKTATIQFSAIGLALEADVIYTPAEEEVTTGPADNWHQGSAPQIDEFVTLTCDGKDALFLLDADNSIYHAIIEAITNAMTTNQPNQGE